MINILFAFLFTSLSFQIFTFSSQYNVVNRSFTMMPLEYFEVSIPLSDSDNLSFDKKTLEEKVDGYINYSLSKKIKNYDLQFSYYQPIDHSYCLSDKCQGVDITLNATLAFSFKYSKTMFYEIRRGKNG